MANNGKARVLTTEQWDNVFVQIEKHRHPEKNEAIMRISRNLGLRAQEIALLKLRDVVKLDTRLGQPDRTFTLYEILTVRKDITKGSNAMRTSRSKYVRKSITFKVEEFHSMLEKHAALVKAGAEIDPEMFYPAVNKKRKTKGRDLPIVSELLKSALIRYVQHRLDKDPYVKPDDPLFLSQRKRAYHPNSLQEHMALMLRSWGGVEKAKSHSGRRGVATHIIHDQKESLRTAQTALGHISPTTTVEYEEPPENKMTQVLGKIDDGS
ncbi:tyrosine-type recombinase/integrase [Alteromonas macleodii]|uniref:Phage integrase family protein n=1 Tax=Alteromonas macleodii TaxID=28108 RepID=A0AB36FL61_ALTMA|nr:tyrosine-type recombinase/integrase [Alteromonas macleodii]OES24158.1 phage integrase family protein [Alteromonas macleodii]OES24792.1 phage integrase family protein [Alteromonas macleodii]OES25070.1 phage integrase family protein [Alteromonas macleodii]OES39113.1 phage integrase family protein [Alteromonas macleodii]